MINERYSFGFVVFDLWMIVRSAVTIIYSGGKSGRNRTLTDPSFIGPEFVHCDVELGVLN